MEKVLSDLTLKRKYAIQDGKKNLTKTITKLLADSAVKLKSMKAGKSGWDGKAESLKRRADIIKVESRRVSATGKLYKRAKKKKARRKKKVSKKTIQTWGKRVAGMKKGQKKKYKKGKRTVTISVNPKSKRRSKKRISRNPSKLGGTMKRKSNPTYEEVSGYNMMETLSLLGGGATYGAVNNWVQRIPGVSQVMAQLQSMFGTLGPGVANSIAPLLAGMGMKFGSSYVPNEQAKALLNNWGEGLVAASFTAVGASLGQQIAGGMSGVIYQPEMGAVDYRHAGQSADFGSEGGQAQLGFVPDGLGNYDHGQLGGRDPGMTEYEESEADYGTFSPGGLN